jgi:hypothetical protein
MVDIRLIFCDKKSLWWLSEVRTRVTDLTGGSSLDVLRKFPWLSERYKQKWRVNEYFIILQHTHSWHDLEEKNVSFLKKLLDTFSNRVKCYCGHLLLSVCRMSRWVVETRNVGLLSTRTFSSYLTTGSRKIVHNIVRSKCMFDVISNHYTVLCDHLFISMMIIGSSD